MKKSTELDLLRKIEVEVRDLILLIESVKEFDPLQIQCPECGEDQFIEPFDRIFDKVEDAKDSLYYLINLLDLERLNESENTKFR